MEERENEREREREREGVCGVSDNCTKYADRDRWLVVQVCNACLCGRFPDR